MPATTRLYGEGFQMLSQTGGTLGQPADLGNYTDAKHYKLPAPGGKSILRNDDAVAFDARQSPARVHFVSPLHRTVLSERSVFESCGGYGRS